MQADPRLSMTDTDLRRAVDAFYARVRQDPLLGPIFDGAIEDWDHHLGKLEAFWSSVMLGSGRYQGQPMAVHYRQAPHMTPQAFDRWLELWRETTNDLFDPDMAAALQTKAARIAESLALGIAFQRDRDSIS